MENIAATETTLEKRTDVKPLVVRIYLATYLILTVGAVINYVRLALLSNMS